MAYYGKCCSKKSCGSYGNRYSKSYDNSTRQTYGQRYSPTKCNDTWYDASGNHIRDKEAYFDAIDRNGRYWDD